MSASSWDTGGSELEQWLYAALGSCGSKWVKIKREHMGAYF